MNNSMSKIPTRTKMMMVNMKENRARMVHFSNIQIQFPMQNVEDGVLVRERLQLMIIKRIRIVISDKISMPLETEQKQMMKMRIIVKD